MPRAISVSRKPRGRPPVGSTNIGVRIPPKLLKAIDQFVADQSEPKPTRPEAVRLLTADALIGAGYLKP